MQAKQTRSEYAANQELLQSSNRTQKLAQSQTFGYTQAFRKANKPTKISILSRFFTKD